MTVTNLESFDLAETQGTQDQKMRLEKQIRTLYMVLAKGFIIHLLDLSKEINIQFVLQKDIFAD